MVTKNYRNITLLGSSHIAAQSVREVEQLFDEIKPRILALELDAQRLNGLLQRDAPAPAERDTPPPSSLHPQLSSTKSTRRFKIREIGMKAYLFAKIASYVEEKLGAIVGVKPGTEMRSAYQRAQKDDVRVALIDRSITVTLKRLSQSITWTEKWHFLIDIAQSVRAYLFGTSQEIPFDIRTVPQEQVILQMIDTVRLRYPNVYQVLVAERNVYMARRLHALRDRFPEEPILAVVGAGHVAEIARFLEEYDAADTADAADTTSTTSTPKVTKKDF